MGLLNCSREYTQTILEFHFSRGLWELAYCTPPPTYFAPGGSILKDAHSNKLNKCDFCPQGVNFRGGTFKKVQNMLLLRLEGQV